MKTFIMDMTPQIPVAFPSESIEARQAWISPRGDVYAFDGAHHAKVATWIACFVENATKDTLKHGKFFRDSFDSWIMKKGYAKITDTRWIGGDSVDLAPGRGGITQAQLDRIFDYDGAHGTDLFDRAEKWAA